MVELEVGNILGVMVNLSDERGMFVQPVTLHVDHTDNMKL